MFVQYLRIYMNAKYQLVVRVKDVLHAGRNVLIMSENIRIKWIKIRINDVYNYVMTIMYEQKSN